MNNIDFCRIKCNCCGCEFQSYQLPDFSYGEFLLFSKNGEVRYLNAINDFLYDEFFRLIDDFNDFSKFPLDAQSIFGPVVCDLDSEGGFFYISPPFCPVCNTNDCSVIEISKIDNCPEIESVSYESWSKLTLEQRVERVKNYINMI